MFKILNCEVDMRKLVTIFSLIIFAGSITACNNNRATCATYALENTEKIKKTEVTVQVENKKSEIPG